MGLYINNNIIDQFLGTIHYGGANDIDRVFFNNTLVWEKIRIREFYLQFFTLPSYKTRDHYGYYPNFGNLYIYDTSAHCVGVNSYKYPGTLPITLNNFRVVDVTIGNYTGPVSLTTYDIDDEDRYTYDTYTGNVDNMPISYLENITYNDINTGNFIPGELLPSNGFNSYYATNLSDDLGCWFTAFTTSGKLKKNNTVINYLTTNFDIDNIDTSSRFYIIVGDYYHDGGTAPIYYKIKCTDNYGHDFVSEQTTGGEKITLHFTRV